MLFRLFLASVNDTEYRFQIIPFTRGQGIEYASLPHPADDGKQDTRQNGNTMYHVIISIDTQTR